MCARKLVYNDKLAIEQYTAQEKAEHREKLNNIKEQLPKQCKSCSFFSYNKYKKAKSLLPIFNQERMLERWKLERRDINVSKSNK